MPRSGGIIYKATNIINGKVYIGKTVQTLKQRKYVHKSYSKRDTSDKKVIFHNALKKYGWENFKWEILCECDDYNLLGIRETMKIIVNNSHYIDGYGYNMTYGGEGCLGYKHSESARKKISKSKTGENNPMFNKTTTGFKGHKHNKKSRENISNSLSESWKNLSSEEKEKRLQGVHSHIITEEERQRRSKSQMGHKSSAEKNKEISESLKRYNMLKKEKMLCSI